MAPAGKIDSRCVVISRIINDRTFLEAGFNINPAGIHAFTLVAVTKILLNSTSVISKDSHSAGTSGGGLIAACIASDKT